MILNIADQEALLKCATLYSRPYAQWFPISLRIKDKPFTVALIDLGSHSFSELISYCIHLTSLLYYTSLLAATSRITQLPYPRVLIQALPSAWTILHHKAT